jgi:hypothetical protein
MLARFLSLLFGRQLNTADQVEHGGLVAEHHAAVAGGKFDQLTLEVSTAMREIGWKYDGWECAVIAKESRS